MRANSGIAAAATLVSLAFMLLLLDRWLTGGKAHQKAWVISMAMFTVAAGSFWWATATGWTAWNFRLFYLFGAILNVAFLALGTCHLLLDSKLAANIDRAVCSLAWFATGIVFASRLKPFEGRGIPEGREVFGAGPRALAALGSGLGATVLIVGALWSALTLARTKMRPAAGAVPAIAAGRLAVANVIIATGAMILGSGGISFGSGDATGAFGWTLLLGISVLFAGFLTTSQRRQPGGTAPQPAETAGSTDARQRDSASRPMTDGRAIADPIFISDLRRIADDVEIRNAVLYGAAR